MSVKHSYSWERMYTIHCAIKFAHQHKIPVEDLQSMCDGKLENFGYWYVDYLKKYREEIRRRIDTGIAREVNLYDVWS